MFTDVVPVARIAREEIFGPVLSVLTFRTPAEAVEKANNTTYGLSAGVWTEKGSRILHMAARLRAGVVWANTFNRFDPASPFGGYRESGFGREGGRHGLEAYLKGALNAEGPVHEDGDTPELSSPEARPRGRGWRAWQFAKPISYISVGLSPARNPAAPTSLPRRGGTLWPTLPSPPEKMCVTPS